MNQKIKILIVIGSLIVLVTGAMLFNSYKDRQIVRETTKLVHAQDRIKLLQSEVAELQVDKDSIKKNIDSLNIILEYQKNNPSIIIKENAKIHIDLDKLDALNSIKLFSENCDEYNRNRERYSLSRFAKPNK